MNRIFIKCRGFSRESLGNFFSLIFIFISTINSAFAQDRFEGICRMEGATGFEAQHERALVIFKKIGFPEKFVITSGTSSSGDGAIYLESYEAIINRDVVVSPAGIYYHSNFVSSGSSYPTKIAYPTGNFNEVLPRIWSGDPGYKFERLEFFLMSKKTNVIIHKNVLSGPVRLNLGPISSFYVTDGQGTFIKVKKSQEREKHFCEIEHLCWDREEGEMSEKCDSEEIDIISALINAVIEGAISGLKCSIKKP